jgi:hypothetical protein
MSERINNEQVVCYLIHTNDRVRDLVRRNVARSPLFNGQIQGIGPRYCPSLEDKIVRFPDKERHQIFLEPEGVDAREIYVNGFSMSLPRDVQTELVHALPGLRGRRAAASRVRRRVRLHPAHRADASTRNEAVVACFSRADQRNVRLRRSGRARPGRRHQCRLLQRASSCGATRLTSASLSTT